ncbi:nicotinamide N-methyltransferase-like [Branchiostoma floridae]|uniref:Nicotinamide N-methyltransferase-like n=2 Tax=Branchiostoma floridae TaxID=7739 RepID=A0A9J7MNU5_BRAFL|nr:nicotinamide N-methyltransferase-like [Branchiostoma floridae]
MCHRMSSKEVETQPFDDDFESAREYLEFHWPDVMAIDNVDEGAAMPWIMDQFHRTFTEDKHFGERLLDVGTGPTVYQLISASRVFTDIVCSDIHQGALEEIRKWKNDDTDAFDWSSALKHVSGLEGTRWEERQGQLRRAIKDTVFCDVHNENPLHPAVFRPFDTIISTYCLEGACFNKGRSTYKKAVKNVCSLLKPGGYIILLSYIGVTYYLKDGKKDPDNLRLDTDFVLKSLSEAGITVLEASEFKTPDRDACSYSDVKSILYVVGKKDLNGDYLRLLSENNDNGV